MRKRTRIAVVVAALLLAVVAPTVNHHQAAEAGTLDWRAVYRTLDAIIPNAGKTRIGRSAALTRLERWQLANVACKVNKVHDNVYEYEPLADDLLSELGWVNPYRYQSAVLELSRWIYQFKDDAGTVYQTGSEYFCDYAEHHVKLHTAGTTR